MNHFLELSGIDTTDTADFVFIDRMDCRYDKPSKSPVESDSNPDSPFVDKSPTEIWEMLGKLCKDTGSKIMVWYIIILDELSTRDGTVLLVTDEGDAEGEEKEGDGEEEEEDADAELVGSFFFPKRFFFSFFFCTHDSECLRMNGGDLPLYQPLFERFEAMLWLASVSC